MKCFFPLVGYNGFCSTLCFYLSSIFLKKETMNKEFVLRNFFTYCYIIKTSYENFILKCNVQWFCDFILCFVLVSNLTDFVFNIHQQSLHNKFVIVYISVFIEDSLTFLFFLNTGRFLLLRYGSVTCYNQAEKNPFHSNR